MCNVTTLSMQLKAIASDNTELMNAAAQVYLDCGGSGDPAQLAQMQLEDLLMNIFKVLGEDYFVSELGVKFDGRFGPHQYRDCLQHVAQMFTDYVGTTTDLGAGDRNGKFIKDPQTFYEEEVAPHHVNGSTMLSTKLTSGHIILLVDIMSDGIVVHDPYGVRVVNGYIKNGEKVSSKKRWVEGATDELETRFKHNPTGLADLQASLTGTMLPGDMGAFNFYTWDQIKKWSIGKWVSCIEGVE
jgi:hypothetical protein